MMPNPPARAEVAITCDLEMCTNFPTWDQTWDLRKGDLDGPTKAYALRAARRAKERGAVIHFFAVGRLFEQDDIEWLQEIVALGHRVGNHTYHHVNLLAQDTAQLQHTYAKWPWRAAGRSIPELIRQEIAMTSAAIRQRLGVEPAGFRTPGGFATGLDGREDLQKLLLAEGFTWASSRYAGVPDLEPAARTGLAARDLERIAASQDRSQPQLYPTGLAEVPMSPLSDIHLFRTLRRELPDFLAALEASLARVIEHGGAFDFLCHPSCLSARDPHLRAIERILDVVDAARGRAVIAPLDALAARAQRAHEPRCGGASPSL